MEDEESIRQRRYSRQSSAASHCSADHDLQMMPLRAGDASGSIGARKRTPSGKSVQSRTISLAEYHQDLHQELKQGLTLNLVLHSLVIWFGSSFVFGYNLGVLNQPSDLIKSFFNETYTRRNDGEVPSDLTTTLLWSFTTAIFFPGGMIGAFSSGFLANKVGRRRAIMISHLPAFVGAVLQTTCQMADAPELLMVGRFVQGINCGLATGLAPMYLTEITPFNLRGAFGTGHQLFITIGIFIGSVLGLREILGKPDLWPYLLLLNAIPAFVSLIAIYFLPESPRYLMLVKRDRAAAEKALQFLRMRTDVDADLEEMETEASERAAVAAEEVNEAEKFTMMKLLKSAELRMPVIIMVVLQVAQQFSGINAIFFFSTTIFKSAGVSEEAIQYAVVATNFVNVAMTIVALPIMDKAGRRPLLLYPMIVMTLDMGVITVALWLQDSNQWLSYVSIICVIVYVICFAVGLGPIPLMTGAELFRQGPRPMAMSLAGVTNWLCTTVIAISFEPITVVIGHWTFIMFMLLMVGFTAFVFFKVPETKNRTFEEIASMFQPGGVIEVEETIDDPEPLETISDAELKMRRPSGGEQNGSAAVTSNDVFVAVKDEERQSLTQSVEDIHRDVDANPRA